jgi:hypothetical protein
VGIIYGGGILKSQFAGEATNQETGKMTRRNREVGIIKSLAIGAALVAALAMPAYAGDNKLSFTGSAVLTTDYMFRSISNTNQEPAAQVEFDASYGMFWAYAWGSNTAFGENIEIDYGLGISPKWRDFNGRRSRIHLPWRQQRDQLFRVEVRCVLDRRRLDPRRQRLLVAG